jgi:hypothetical protein
MYNNYINLLMSGWEITGKVQLISESCDVGILSSRHGSKLKGLVQTKYIRFLGNPFTNFGYETRKW